VVVGFLGGGFGGFGFWGGGGSVVGGVWRGGRGGFLFFGGRGLFVFLFLGVWGGGFPSATVTGRTARGTVGLTTKAFEG